MGLRKSYPGLAPLFLSASLCLFADAGRLFAQFQNVLLSEATTDSTLESEDWQEESHYRIGILRLQRWVRSNLDDLNDPVLSAEIARLLKEADDLAKSGDYYLANVWLETIWDLIETTSGADPAANDETSPVLGDGSNAPSKPNSSVEVLSGIDLWRQEFEFSFLDGDSTYLDGNGNPYSGVRFDLAYRPGRERKLQTRGFFKYSRDYLSGNLDLEYSEAAGQLLGLRIENRFEGTSFFDESSLRYWQNQTSVAVLPRFKPVSFEFRDELTLRRYGESDSTFSDYLSNYLHNALSISARLNSGFNTFLDAGYRNTVRLHTDLDLNDYREHSAYLSFSQTFAGNSSIAMENQLRRRQYPNAPPDHFFQDFWEYYGWGKLDLGFMSSFGTEVRGNVTYRTYEFVNASSLPDYTFWEIEPQLYVRPSPSCRLAAGLHYDRQKTQNLENRIPRTDAASVASFGTRFEDYYSVGPVFTLDVFKIDRILLSLQESYLFRTYPNSASLTDVSLNLYSNRVINNILLFATWHLSARWQLNILANMDDDRSRDLDTGDSRNALLGMEVSHRF